MPLSLKLFIIVTTNHVLFYLRHFYGTIVVSLDVLIKQIKIILMCFQSLKTRKQSIE